MSEPTGAGLPVAVRPLARARSLGARYGWALLAPGFTLLAAFAMNAVASRALGPAGFGQFAVASTLVTLLGIVMSLGMPTTVVALSGRRAADPLRVELPGEADRAYEATRAAAIGLVTLVGVLLSVVLVGIERALGGAVERWIPLGTAVAVGAASLGTALLDLALADMQRALAFRAYFARMVGAAGLRLAGVVVGIMAGGPTARAAIWGYAVATTLTGLALVAPGLAGFARGARRRDPALREALQRVSSFGAPVLASSAVVATMSWIDPILLAARLPADDVGVYAAASRLTVVPTTLIGGMTSIALPLAARAWHAGGEALHAFKRRAGVGGLAVGALATLSLAAVAPLLVALVFGDEFAPTVLVFVALLVGFLPNYPGNPLSQLLYSAGRTRLMLAIHVCQLVAILVGLGVLAGRASLVGIAAYKSAVNVAAMAVVIGAALRMRNAHATDAGAPPP